MSEKKYTAFVSYSHKDDKWAKWLLRALESYKVPSHLVGTEGSNGPVPKRVSRIFRDREELAAGSHLDEKIQEALEQSQTLLVVCSPNATHSYGVNKEIELFRKIRGDDHIFYIIKEGEPHASARGYASSLECFPKALLDHSLTQHTLHGVPLAADARPHADGPKMALMKVIAGILGVNLDSLVRRDLQRRQRRLFGVASLASLGMLVTTTLATQAYLATQRAEEALAHAHRQQDEAESLIEFIVDTLGFNLWQRGQFDLLETMHKRLITHYEGANSPEMGPREIARKVRGLRFLLRSKLHRGHNEKVLKGLKELLGTTSALITKEPGNVAIINTHITILRLLTESNWLAGDFDEVAKLTEERRLYAIKYAELTKSSTPIELGNVYMVLGLLKMHEQQPEEALRWVKKSFDIRMASSYSPDLLDAIPGNIPGAYMHLSRVEEIVAPIEQALATKRISLKQSLRTKEHYPDKIVYAYLYWRSHFELAELLVSAGLGKEAIAAAQEAQQGFVRVLKKDPKSMRYALMEARLGIPIGIQYSIDNDWEKAASTLGETQKKIGEVLSKSDMPMDGKAWLLRAKAHHAKALVHLNSLTEAETLLREIDDFYKSSRPTSFRTVFGRKMRAVFFTAKAELAAAQGNLKAETLAYKELIDIFGDNWRTCHPMVRFETMKAFTHLGDTEAAEEIAQNLQSIGFKRHDFHEALGTLAKTPAHSKTALGAVK